MTMKRFFCIPVLFLLAACANDLGNYDYRDLTEPDITGIEANISVLTHARLQLTPGLGGNDFPTTAIRSSGGRSPGAPMRR